MVLLRRGRGGVCGVVGVCVVCGFGCDSGVFGVLRG